MTGSKHQFHTLDALRGIAAIAVVMLHMPDILGGQPLPGAGIAVDLFFTMSGFVIAHAYDPRLSQGMTASKFLRLRLIRLYPLYLAGLILSVAGIASALLAGVGTDDWTWAKLFESLPPGLLMVPADSGPLPDLYPLNMVAWSLFFELLVNIAYALAFRWMTLRVLGGVVVVSALALAWSAAAMVPLDGGVWWSGFPIGLARIGFAFPLGVIFGRLYRAGRLPRLDMPVMVVCAVAVAMMAARPASGTGRMLYDLAALLLICPAIVFAAVGSAPRRMIPLYDSLGAISYPLYMLHIPFLRMIRATFEGASLNGMPWVGALVIAALLAIAWLADRFYDRPARTWLTALKLPSSGRRALPSKSQA